MLPSRGQTPKDQAYLGWRVMAQELRAVQATFWMASSYGSPRPSLVLATMLTS